MTVKFRHRKLQVGNCTIDFETAGNRQGLLLLHGFPETKLAWHKIAPQLTTNYTVVIPDLPGYGDSTGEVQNKKPENYSKRKMGELITMENWPFLSQPAPFPETLISANPFFYLTHILDSWSLFPELISKESRDEYLRCFQKPAVIAGYVRNTALPKLMPAMTKRIGAISSEFNALLSYFGQSMIFQTMNY